jgi:hypothetical protein
LSFGDEGKNFDCEVANVNDNDNGIEETLQEPEIGCQGISCLDNGRQTDGIVGDY